MVIDTRKAIQIMLKEDIDNPSDFVEAVGFLKNSGFQLMSLWMENTHVNRKMIASLVGRNGMRSDGFVQGDDYILLTDESAISLAEAYGENNVVWGKTGRITLPENAKNYTLYLREDFPSALSVIKSVENRLKRKSTQHSSPQTPNS